MMFSLEEISKLIKEKKISPKEVVLEYIDKIRKTDTILKNFITVCEEQVLNKASRLEKLSLNLPFYAIPYACKDNICTKNIRTTAGSKMLENFVPFYNATCIEALSENLLLGKTNMDEFGMGASGETSYFGISKNPHDIKRTAGGSSCGSASAVASGQAVFALGSDTGGSVRQPASLCGVVGFKPSYGAISRYGLIAFASSLDTIGIISQNVNDAEKVFMAISGKDTLDMTSENICPEKEIKRLNIGIPKEYLENCDKEVKEKVTAYAKKLEYEGHTVFECSLAKTEYIVPTYYIISSVEASSNLARYDGIRYGSRGQGQSSDEILINTRSKGFGSEVKSRILLGNFVLSGKNFDEYYKKAVLAREQITKDFENAFLKCDFLLTPTVGKTAWRTGETPNDTGEKYTAGANLAKLPAITVNAGYDSEGLPIGIQLIGPRHSDLTLLCAAKLLEVL